MTFSSAPLVDGRRPAALRRCWLFLPGADRGALLGASTVRADVLIQELEDFTPPERRPEARAMAAEIYSSWRGAGIVAAVRVNPLETEGRADLAAVMRGRPDVVIMSKVAEPAQVAALDEEVMRLERHFDIPPGTTELAPNVESARGIMQTYAIAKASRRVTAVLGSTEDVTADLGAPRSKNAVELAYPPSACTSNAPPPMFCRSTAPIPLRMWAAANPMRVMHGSSVTSRRARSIPTTS